jgi:hypothetical protein
MVKHQKVKSLFLMEIKYRWITYYQRKINKMLEGGISLNHPQLVSTYSKYEKYIYQIFEMKETFEKETKEKIVFYQNFSPAKDKTGVMNVVLGTIKGFLLL